MLKKLLFFLYVPGVSLDKYNYIILLNQYENWKISGENTDPENTGRKNKKETLEQISTYYFESVSTHVDFHQYLIRPSNIFINWFF